MNFLDLSYYRSGSKDPLELIRSHSANMGYLDHLPPDCHPSVVKFMDYEGEWKYNRIQYYFLKANASTFWIPYKQNRFIKKLNPDIILLHGLIFPIQVITLASQLGKRTRLIIQHHADHPSTGPNKILQQLADKYISAYFFASGELAEPWVNSGIIKSRNKIFELPTGSTSFAKGKKEEARKITGVSGNEIFLWVGRLNANKDPLTVIKGFLPYAKEHQAIRLYMIYQTAELVDEIRELIHLHQAHDQIILVGKKPKEELEHWYNSADYFISGSHAESCGYAFIESMACGCIPIVPAIPTFKKFTDEGKFGLLYNPGDGASLLDALRRLSDISKNELSNAVIEQFHSALSFNSIARSIYAICQDLIIK